MPAGHSDVLRHLGALFTTGSATGVPDRQLLERFILRRDEFAEAAFAVLVARHGPMVLKLCRSILRNPHDADDAFQATFMLLAAKACRIGKRDLLANWLYGVALRTALKARTRAFRRRKYERRAAECAIGQSVPREHDLDLHRALHEGIKALPEKYRAAIVLCHLEGMTREEAARLLNCPASTVGVRLMRARERLRVWLKRRHHHADFSAGLIAASLETRPSLHVPVPLAEATVEAAILLSSRATQTLSAGSASIVNLMKEVQMSLFVSKLKVVASSLVMCGLLTAGIASMAQQPPPPSAPARTAQDEVLDLERAWGDALVHNDAALMDRIVAYEMVGTDPAAHRWNKSEYLESVKSGAFKIESFALADVKVQVFGDAAVATGRSIVNKHSKSGFPPGAAVFTDTYVRRNGCWQCVAWQSAAAPDQVQTQTSGLPEQRPPADTPLIPGAPKAQELSAPIVLQSTEPRTEVPGPPPMLGLQDPKPIIQALPPLPHAESPGAPAPSAPKNPTVSPAQPKPTAE
jgi:RNA polymerase sigma factor (sigma-70 family)